MTLEQPHVVIVPWRTLEADCLALLLREAGLAPAPDATAETAACILAPPRRVPLSQSYPLPQELAGLPTVLVVDTFDARAIALKQVTGAVGVLTWESDALTLTEGIRAVASGRAPVPRQRRGQAVASDACSRMTERERDVLTLVAMGHRDDEIAAQLGISAHTVRTHLQHAMTKLEVTHRRAAAAILWTSLFMPSRSGLDPVSRWAQ